MGDQQKVFHSIYKLNESLVQIDAILQKIASTVNDNKERLKAIETLETTVADLKNRVKDLEDMSMIVSLSEEKPAIGQASATV